MRPAPPQGRSTHQGHYRRRRQARDPGARRSHGRAPLPPPLAGLLLALPALEGTGLLEAARQVFGRLKDGFYGLATRC